MDRRMILITLSAILMAAAPVLAQEGKANNPNGIDLSNKWGVGYRFGILTGNDDEVDWDYSNAFSVIRMFSENVGVEAEYAHYSGDDDGNSLFASLVLAASPVDIYVPYAKGGIGLQHRGGFGKMFTSTNSISGIVGAGVEAFFAKDIGVNLEADYDIAGSNTSNNWQWRLGARLYF